MRGASRAGQEEGKPRLSFFFVFSGAGQGRTGTRSGRDTRGTGNTGCLFVGPQDGRMARQRHPHGTGTGAQWNKGAERLCGTAKNYAVRIGKRGGGNKLRTSGPGGQERRPGADLGRPGSGNGPSEEGQSMKRAERAQGTTGVRAFGRGGSRHAAGPWAQKKPLQFPARAKYGGPSGTRTPNQLIKSQLLYQLS